MAVGWKPGSPNPAPIPDERRPAGPTPMENPYAYPSQADIDAYEKGTYGYPVSTIQGASIMGQYYDPMRQRAMNTVNAGVGSGQKTTMTQLASSGGLSAADRQAIADQSRRQRVNLMQGAQSPYDQLQAQNFYETQNLNASMGQSTMDMNQKILNQRAQDMASEYEKKATNIYEQRLKEAMLERQLEAARAIARNQGA